MNANTRKHTTFLPRVEYLFTDFARIPFQLMLSIFLLTEGAKITAFSTKNMQNSELLCFVRFPTYKSRTLKIFAKQSKSKLESLRFCNSCAKKT